MKILCALTVLAALWPLAVLAQETRSTYPESPSEQREYQPTEVLTEIEVLLELMPSHPDTKTLKNAVANLAELYHQWNPTISEDVIAQSIAGMIKTHGVDNGLIGPALVFTDMALFYNESKLANTSASNIALINSKVGQILEQKVGLSIDQFSGKTNKPFNIPSSISSNKYPSMADILIGKGSRDFQGINESENSQTPNPLSHNGLSQTPLFGRDIFSRSNGDKAQCFASCFGDTVVATAGGASTSKSPWGAVILGTLAGGSKWNECTAKCWDSTPNTDDIVERDTTKSDTTSNSDIESNTEETINDTGGGCSKGISQCATDTGRATQDENGETIADDTGTTPYMPSKKKQNSSKPKIKMYDPKKPFINPVKPFAKSATKTEGGLK